MSRPLMVYDGDCDFCRVWLARWRRATGDAVDYAPYQEVASRHPEIPLERFRAAVHLREPDGTWTYGAAAVFRTLAYAKGHGKWRWLYEHVPPFAGVSEWSYRLVARHRPFFFRVTRALWGSHVVPPGNALTTWIFLRLLGLVYAVAFASLGAQVVGLIGAHGILPVDDYLPLVREQIGPIRGLWFAPSVLWVAHGDGALRALCGVGLAASVLLALGVAPLLGALVAWVSYLSLVTVARDFLGFQWDGLLLESGFIALFLAPWCLWSRPGADAPPRAALRILRWLLFRLMFSSAVVKLSSGDPTWRDLTALDYHYWTQPLPTWTAWYMNLLPPGFQKLSVGVMFAIEGLVPFLIVGPRHVRFFAVGAIVFLQLLIMGTGNYAFFNWLALALCVPLLDDGVWPARGRPKSREPTTSRTAPSRLARVVASLLFVTSLVPLAGAFRVRVPALEPLRVLSLGIEPFRVVNPYGLFQVMTTTRPEIVIEGSDDGATWEPYEFRWKVGDVRRRPEFVEPHQPRLDWQMWFAALSSFRESPWFLSFCHRLLDGSAPVTALLERNPFPRAPPRFLRAIVYDYHFTDAATRRATGAWWRRAPLGLYCPVLTLVDGKLTAVEMSGP
jgi:predicted DCC family thiol-disulfide oxidoreductase YuxK